MGTTGRLIFLLALAAFAVPSQADTPTRLQGLDHYILKSMRAWRVPGLAIAIVKDGRIVKEQGYGERELGKPAKVDKNTIFAIASNSKAFTTVALGTLVDSGELGWDDHVTRYLPDFELYSPYATREVTVRDLLTHRTGYCNGGFLEYGTNNTRADIMHKLRLLKPRYPFRATFCYSNIMVTMAAQIIPAITGEQWHQAVQKRIFKPLDMAHSDTLMTFKPHGDTAAPHSEVDGKVQPIRWYYDANDAPAGGVVSSVSDMAHWLEMLLNDGTWHGREIVSPAVIHEMETPQIAIPPDSFEGSLFGSFIPQAHSLSYGLTLFMNDYRGYHIDWHYGETDGFQSALGMIPSLHLGVVVLSNRDENWLPVALMYRVIDAYIGAPNTDWSARLLKITRQRGAAGQVDALAKARVPDSRPPVPPADYVGVYTDPLYGKVTVSMEDGHLVLRRGRLFVGDLQHWDHDTFRITWRYHYLGHGYAEFLLNPAGQVHRLKLIGVGTYTRRKTQ
ncbi:MAG TPA: serine hydrolase [Gammaproteobacteria bacterium]|nr:serine hydrolase [Gammaproteobacteria bacterium]